MSASIIDEVNQDLSLKVYPSQIIHHLLNLEIHALIGDIDQYHAPIGDGK